MIKQKLLYNRYCDIIIKQKEELNIQKTKHNQLEEVIKENKQATETNILSLYSKYKDIHKSVKDINKIEIQHSQDILEIKAEYVIYIYQNS